MKLIQREDIHRDKYSIFFTLDQDWYINNYYSLIERLNLKFEIFSPPKWDEKLEFDKKWNIDELLRLYLAMENWKKPKTIRMLSKLICKCSMTDGSDYFVPIDSWRIRENLKQFVTCHSGKENNIPIDKLTITTNARHTW